MTAQIVFFRMVFIFLVDIVDNVIFSKAVIVAPVRLLSIRLCLVRLHHWRRLFFCVLLLRR